jgi:hypothetical protein
LIDVPSDLFMLREVPSYIRFENGPEFVVKTEHDWIDTVGAKAAYTACGNPSAALARSA